MGGGLLHGVVGVGFLGNVVWRVFFLLLASFGVDAGEGSINAFAMVVVGGGNFGWWEGELVTASSALFGVVRLATGVVTHIAFAVGAAVLSSSGVAYVTLLCRASNRMRGLLVSALCQLPMRAGLGGGFGKRLAVVCVRRSFGGVVG